ncbi:hypothetical protein BGZ60DRAFT_522630 [Tricladium varicosporioides]|nr:hypothetical protein BGZ60DRAFT_522630 [Hymenoscyphus varicosporioides]
MPYRHQPPLQDLKQQQPPPVLLSQAALDQAGGGVPSGPLPQSSFSANAMQNFKVADFIEGIESGFFAAALNSLNKNPNFKDPDGNGLSIANITTQIAAQELVHKAILEGLLGLVMEPTIPLCTTIFPINDTNDYLAKVNIVTSAAIGSSLRHCNLCHRPIPIS